MQDQTSDRVAELQQIPSFTKPIEVPTLDSLSTDGPVDRSKSVKSLRSLRVLQRCIEQENGSSNNNTEGLATDDSSDSLDTEDVFEEEEERTFPGTAHAVGLKKLKISWTNFLEYYGSGDCNLSVVERPVCFHGLGFMAPPDFRQEAKRIYESRCALESKVWKRKNLDLQETAREIVREYNVESLTVTVIDRSLQHVVFSVNQNIPELPRNVSIDGHTILSKQCFVLLDALKDWRFSYNPVAFGPPFIRFYAGVALYSNESPIGAVSVYNSYGREFIPNGLVKRLAKFSEEISNRLEEAQKGDGCLTSGWPQGKGLDSIEEELKQLPTHALGANTPALRRLNCNEMLTKSRAVSSKISECRDVRSAFSVACKDLCQQLNIDFAYIVEVRISNKYFISKQKTARYRSGVYCTEIENLNEFLGEKADFKIKTRVLGDYNLPVDELVLDEFVHRSALNSEYGVSFCGEK